MIASSIAPSCKIFRTTLLFVGNSDVFVSRVLDCSFPRASVCLDFPIEAGLIKHPIAHPTGQSRHYTIQPCSILWRTKGNGAMRSHGAISWLRKRREIDKSVQYERHDFTVQHAMVSRHGRGFSSICWSQRALQYVLRFRQEQLQY
jgi:hypothetical protein